MRVIAVCLLSIAFIAPAAGSEVVLVPADAGWTCLDDGSNPAGGWPLPGFDDSAWPYCTTRMGCSRDGEHATTYLRHSFEVGQPQRVRELRLRLRYRGGTTVYLNGVEVLRSGPQERGSVRRAAVDPVLLLRGVNVLAVELHPTGSEAAGDDFELDLVGDPGAAAVLFTWSGAPTLTSIRVNARIDTDTDRVRLLVSEQPDLSVARFSEYFEANAELDNRVVSVSMNGLQPGKSYHYAWEVDYHLDLLHRGQFSTSFASATSFTFAFASCARTGSSHSVFDLIRSYDSLFFLHAGDFHYENIGVNDPDVFRAAYDTVLASPTQSALYRSLPIVYMWDDHDYGPNNSDSTAPGREASRMTYQEYVPHFPLVAGEGDVPIYQSFSVGRVRFIVLDSRSERDPHTTPDLDSKTMLGPEQKSWFKQELLAANGIYPVIVWVNTLPWIGTTGDDGWHRYTFERRELADFIADNGIRGVVMLSGDAHMLAIDDGTNSDYSASGEAAFPVFHAAALDRNGSVKGGPYSHGAFPGGGQFGLMTVEDDGENPICIDWSGRNEFDEEVVGYQFCQEAAPPPDTDGDGVDDRDDCSFANPELWSTPGVVTGVRLGHRPDEGFEIVWDSLAEIAGPATSYDVVEGSLSDLRQTGGFDRATCLAAGLEEPHFVDSAVPPSAGPAGYYLVRARNGCGSGGFGADDHLDPRFALGGNTPCPLP